MRSQSGTGSGVALTVTPSNICRMEPQLFRVLLLRTPSGPLPSLSRLFCRCGLLLDSFGHHHTAYSRADVLGRHGFALECRSPNLQESRWASHHQHVHERYGRGSSKRTYGRRLEVVADGLPLFDCALLAVDTTFGVTPPRQRFSAPTLFTWMAQPSPQHDGGRNVHTQNSWDPRAEHGWSSWPWKQEADEALAFVRLLAGVKARGEPRILKKRVEQAWRLQ